MNNEPQTVKVFRYIAELDAFVVTEEYERRADTLGLREWTPVMWIGRLFTRDNDFGEHWFDNWELCEAQREHAQRCGLDESELLIVDPDRFQDGRDGPCHSPAQRKRFWSDVLRSLTLSYDLLFEESRATNERMKEMKNVFPEDYIVDLEMRIAAIRAEHLL